MPLNSVIGGQLLGTATDRSQSVDVISNVRASMSSLPMANAVPSNTKDDFRGKAASRGLVGAANSTKWNELISFARGLSGWRPSYRSKSVTGYISEWDVEWFYHLPFPFTSVQWLDIGLHEQVAVGRTFPPEIVDHSELILPVLQTIGFEFEVRKDVVRIWGYLPKCYEDFAF